MPLYESVFVIRPTLSDEETEKIVAKMKRALEKSGATIMKSEIWGKKRLAYEVKRERKGTYVYFNFQSGGQVIGELERSYRLEDAVFKFMTVKQEERTPPKPRVQTKEPEHDGV